MVRSISPAVRLLAVGALAATGLVAVGHGQAGAATGLTDPRDQADPGHHCARLNR